MRVTRIGANQTGLGWSTAGARARQSSAALTTMLIPPTPVGVSAGRIALCRVFRVVRHRVLTGRSNFCSASGYVLDADVGLAAKASRYSHQFGWQASRLCGHTSIWIDCGVCGEGVAVAQGRSEFLRGSSAGPSLLPHPASGARVSHTTHHPTVQLGCDAALPSQK
jgi:hypothetical protein